MDRLKRVESLFHRALELEKENRAEFLESECEGDENLIREVNALLESDGANDDFLEEPFVASGADEAETPSPGVKEGTVLGRHRLLSPIGVGGMGFVYKAEDIKSGQIDGGFIPKVESALQSLKTVGEVIIVPGKEAHGLRREIGSDKGAHGTMFVP